MRAAAVDVGTNTVRLLVVDGDAELDRTLEMTRLGRGVDDTGRFDPGSVDRTVEAIARAVSRARDLGAQRIRVAGTSAVRDADDREALRERVRRETGAQLDVLTGAEEARYSFIGATMDADDGTAVVCDIGGGSTEFVLGSGEVSAAHSMDVGSVRVRERCLRSDPPEPREVEAAREMILGGLDEVASRVPLTGAEEFIGVAGTVTTLCSVVLGSERYDPERVHGTVMRRREIDEWSGRLLRMRTAEILEIPTVPEGRADVIAAGVLILALAMNRFGFADVRVSERDILDGLVADLMRS